MSEIKFDKSEKSSLVQKVKMYFREKLNWEIGDFGAEFLIDFFANEEGSHFYNRRIYDAQAMLVDKDGEFI